MRCSFFLQDSRKAKSAVYFVCRHDGKRIKISTGIRVDTKSWDVKEARVKRNSTGDHINSRLRQIDARADAAFNQARGLGITDTTALFNFVKSAIVDSGLLDFTPSSTETLIPSFEDFLNQLHQGSRPTKRKVSSTVSYSYLQMFLTLKNIIAEFVPSGAKFDHLETDDFATKFNTYRSEHWNDHTARKYIQLFRRFLLWAKDARLHSGDFPSCLTLPDEHDPSLFALTAAELQSIEQLDLSERPSLDRVRDLFLISCFTGLRYSDVSRLGAEHIGAGAITISAQKTGETSRCPITPRLRMVLDKYAPEYQFPKISSQKANAHLKTIATTAGVTDRMEVVTWKSGKKSVETKCKNDIISWHCARRTFITLSLIMGANQAAVQAVSGHKKDSKSFNKYVLYAENQVDAAMNEVWK